MQLSWDEADGVHQHFRVMDIKIPNMGRSYSMRTIRVNKGDLLTKVKRNRDDHRQMFEAACVGYREAVIVALDAMLADAKANRRIRTSVDLPAPQDQTKEYDRVLAQLAMETRDEVELTDEEFANYVMDDWRWKQQVVGLSAMYADAGEAVVDRDGLSRTSYSPKKFL